MSIGCAPRNRARFSSFISVQHFGVDGSGKPPIMRGSLGHSPAGDETSPGAARRERSLTACAGDLCGRLVDDDRPSFKGAPKKDSSSIATFFWLGSLSEIRVLRSPAILN